MEKDLVSVIIPTFNRGKYILEAVDSVLKQTYTNYEIIIIDDGSTDNTQELIHTIQHPLKEKLKYFYKENEGVSAARNFGIKNSKGNLIAFLDSDDIWLPEKLEKQIKLLIKYPDVGFVYTGFRYKEENRLLNTSKAKAYYDRDVYFELINFNLRIATPTVILRRECIDKVGFFNELYRACEDQDLWIRIAEFYNFGFINEGLVIVNNDSDNKLTSNLIEAERRYYDVINKNWDKFPNSTKNNNMRRKTLAKTISWIAVEYYKHKNFEKFVEYYIKACTLFLGNHIALPDDKLPYIYGKIILKLQEIQIEEKINYSKEIAFIYFRTARKAFLNKEWVLCIKAIFFSFFYAPCFLLRLIICILKNNAQNIN